MTVAVRSRQAMAIWLVGLAIYFVAVLHRSSLAVAGLLAAERFDISASQLSTFVVLQLLVYALMQIPVGIMVDRFGPRRVLLTGTAILTVAQLSFAFADSYTGALLSRTFVGIGDAMTFICVLRLVTAWFPTRRIPLMTQLTGVLGQLGAVAAAVPMTWAFSTLGWTRAYVVIASIGAVLFVVALFMVRDTPDARSASRPSMGLTEIWDGLKASWEHPGTRLGFWMHFSTQFSATVLGLLWGYPFLVQGQGQSSASAGVLLTVMVLSIMAFGPIFAWLITRWPWHRSTLVLLVVASIASMWALVLAWPGSAPFGVLVVLVVVCGMGGPASMIGFDLGRTSNPVVRVGTATGIINQAGFLASLLTVAMIGLVLDWRTPDGGSGYSADAFTWAMSTQFVLWGFGALQIWRYRRKGRNRLLREDPVLWSQQSGRPVPDR
ncbi:MULTISPECIES: nitrate/nitrite transporter [unclassified Gordonia (in: high G+C Gram-positive bacteria)]|uniref:MFS transporter n=1 Tax=unclassified Gordonia (in: high G+C Gram-positive bacteria) TaxID=2657482 RepID=UPI001F10E44E|nr:MFS transporter [Gordonia sp. ABSL49_1]MCH5644730.1 MFS transporter [Gordonia sp. ABSL49_1]